MVSLLALTLVIGYRVLRHRSAAPPAQPAPAGQPGQPNPARTLWVDPQVVAGFQGQLATYLAGRSGTYGVAMYDLTTGASFGINQDDLFRAASVNKLELAVALYRRAAARQLSLDATTIVTAADIQNYGTGIIQSQPPGQSYSFRELARLMLQESDNTASYVIGQRLGLDSVQAEVASWGLKSTNMADNQTTASDVVLLLSRLKRGELLPASETGAILELLQHTAWNDRLQSGVPATLPVAHKIGTDIGVYNDAALFLDPQHPYIAVVLSGGTEESDALASMTQISRLAYQFEAALPAATRNAR